MSLFSLFWILLGITGWITGFLELFFPYAIWLNCGLVCVWDFGFPLWMITVGLIGVGEIYIITGILWDEL